jgi:hypothetical protein
MRGTKALLGARIRSAVASHSLFVLSHYTVEGRDVLDGNHSYQMREP